MNEAYKDKLRCSGIGVDEGIGRFMGNEDLYERFLKKFLEDHSMEELNEKFRCGNLEEAFRAAHTLKGVAGNLSLTVLYEQSARIVEILRGGSAEGVAPMLEELNRCYETLCEAIRSEQA